MTDTFYADVSIFQPVADASYPRPMLAFRVDHGNGIDDHAAGNWAFARSHDRIEVALAYVVFKPGEAHAIFDRVKAFFGGGKAPWKLAVMIDMESGNDFAGPGDHSVGANELAELFAIWLGSRSRVIGYANGGDWAACWPTRPAWLKRVTAAYSTTDPGTFGWQYYGATGDPSPLGYPRSCPPFGSHVDMNVIHHPIGEIVAALGIKYPPDSPHWSDTVTRDEIVQLIKGTSISKADVTAIARGEVLDGLRASLLGGDHGAYTHEAHSKIVPDAEHGVIDRIAALEAKATKP